MTSRRSVWGNSTRLRMPAKVLEAPVLKPGDFVYVRLLDSADIRVHPNRMSMLTCVDESNAAKPRVDNS